METKDVLTLIISGSAVAVAAVSAVKALVEYRLQGAAKRSDIFLQMRSRLRSDASLAQICGMLEVDDARLKDLPLVERDRFIGFFEELAILRNSGLLNDTVSLYMFGYFAIRCYRSENFWFGLNRNQPLWSLFMDYAQQMEEAQQRFAFDRRDFKL